MYCTCTYAAHYLIQYGQYKGMALPNLPISNICGPLKKNAYKICLKKIGNWNVEFIFFLGTFCLLGRFVLGRFVPWDVLSWDVLSVHPCTEYLYREMTKFKELIFLYFFHFCSILNCTQTFSFWSNKCLPVPSVFEIFHKLRFVRKSPIVHNVQHWFLITNFFKASPY